VYVSASVTYSYAQDELYKKSLKGYFKLQKDFLPLSPKPKTSIHIFDHTIKPIALYGCEIGGTFNSNTARFRNGTLSPDRIYSNLICEKLHTKFCKFIFGVHKKATNFAFLSELGHFPLYYDIIKSILHYWNRLEYLENFHLLQNAYEQSKQLYNQNKSSWYGSLQRILQNSSTISQLKGKKISKTV
jgi:hypothetical protein